MAESLQRMRIFWEEGRKYVSGTVQPQNSKLNQILRALGLKIILALVQSEWLLHYNPGTHGHPWKRMVKGKSPRWQNFGQYL